MRFGVPSAIAGARHGAMAIKKREMSCLKFMPNTARRDFLAQPSHISKKAQPVLGGQGASGLSVLSGSGTLS